MSDPKPHIQVACAIIHKDGLILATQRPATTSLPLKWEFPGGKLEPGETPEECLLRELREELGISVRIYQQLEPLTHTYPDLTVTLYPFHCDQPEGELVLHEHQAARWMSPKHLQTLDWAEADLPLITALARLS